MKIPRRNLLRSGLAAAGGAAFAPQAAFSQPGGRKFKAWVSRGFGRNTTSLEELTLLPISGRQVVVRTEVTQCCYTMAGRMLGTQDPPDPNGPQAAPILNDPNQPIIQGHGGVGIVEAVGPDVRRVQAGDRVIVAVTPQCGQCYHCLRGRADRCQFLAAIKTVPIAILQDGTQVVEAGNIGGISELMVAFEESVVPVFTKVPPIELAMLHCVGGCGLGTTMTLAPVEPGSDVAVFGAGPVGLSAVQGARIMGAAQIIAVEPIRARRELALRLGATTALDPNAEGNNLVPKIKDLCKGPTDRKFAGGHICTTGVGYPPQATLALPVNQWTNGSKSHHSSQYGGVNMMRDLPRYVRLIEKGLYDGKSLITSTYPLEKTMEAYQAVADRTTVTAMIVFG